MKKIISSLVITACVMGAGAALLGKMGPSRLDKIAAQCKEEHLVSKPSKTGWQNLSTQARSRKKREFDEWQKKRINLYRDLETFIILYNRHVEGDACRKNECRPTPRLRQQIITACPDAGASLPEVTAGQ